MCNKTFSFELRYYDWCDVVLVETHDSVLIVYVTDVLEVLAVSRSLVSQRHTSVFLKYF
jgi:hypothetical protein